MAGWSLRFVGLPVGRVGEDACWDRVRNDGLLVKVRSPFRAFPFVAFGLQNYVVCWKLDYCVGGVRGTPKQRRKTEIARGL